MKLLIILGNGGHTAQMLRLVNLLGKKYPYEYVIEKNDIVSERKITLRGHIYKFKKTRNIKESLAKSAIKQVVALPSALKIIKESKVDAVISCGPNFSIPIMLAAKMYGKKIIFMETWSRIYKKSITGAIAYKFADLFFVQWPEMKKVYPNAIYAGRLA